VIRIVRGKGIVQDRFGANATQTLSTHVSCGMTSGESTAKTVNDEKFTFTLNCHRGRTRGGLSQMCVF
jgi:hypothetical protein